MRTFIAIKLPPAVQSAIDDTARRLCEHLHSYHADRAVRWTPADKRHLTLRFLGDTSVSQQRQLIDSLAVVARTHATLRLNVGQLNGFPSLHAPRVVWLAVDGELARLAWLQADIELAAQQAGFAAETRAYTPHLTLGRVSRGLSRAEQSTLGDSLAELTVEGGRQNKGAAFEVNSLVLMRSVLEPQGARYTTLQQFPLG